MALGDAARRLAPTAYAMNDTYMNPKNYSENRALVANNLGTACFDYPLMAAGGFIGAKAVDLVPNSFASITARYSGQDERRAVEWLKAAVKEPISMENRPVVKPLDTAPVDFTSSYRAPENPAFAMGSSELGAPLCDRPAVLAALEAARKMPEGQRLWGGIEKPPTAIESSELGAPLCDRAAVKAGLDKLMLQSNGLNGAAFSGAEASETVNPFFNPKALTYGTSEIFPESAFMALETLHEIPHATMEPFRPYHKESFDNLRDALWERRSEW